MPVKTGLSCTLCGRREEPLIPWAFHRLCLDCTDRQLDLLAEAVKDQPVTPGRGAGCVRRGLSSAPTVRSQSPGRNRLRNALRPRAGLSGPGRA